VTKPAHEAGFFMVDYIAPDSGYPRWGEVMAVQKVSVYFLQTVKQLTLFCGYFCCWR